MRASSDIDICVYYDDEVDRASEFRLRVLSNLFDDIYDIKIFQQMPVYARVEVLKGKVLYCDDRRFLYDKAYETIKEFDSFKRIYYDYIGAEPSDEARGIERDKMKAKQLRATLIRSKLTEIVESVELVREHIPDSFEDFSGLGLVKDGIYKRIEFAIENVFDICAIINSDLTREMPESEEGIVENLADRGILNKEMLEKIRKMKGFRNIVVRRYGRIDDRIAYDILRNSLEDFYTFTELIESFLETNC